MEFFRHSQELWGAVGVICEFAGRLLRHCVGLCGLVAWITKLPSRILVRVVEWVVWGRHLALDLFYKCLHLALAAGLLAIFPILFIFVMPLYARRFVCRFQAS